MKTKRLVSYTLIAFMMLSVAFNANSQTRKEATDAYNAGAQMYRDNPEAALGLLYQALEISIDLGEEADETRVAAESLIPRAHLEMAMGLYRERNLDESLVQLQKAEETAVKYGDGSTKNRVERIMPQLYNQLGNAEYRQDNFEEAIEYYRKATEVNPDYVDPFLGIALSLENLEDFEGMLEALKETIEAADRANERSNADDAIRKAKNYLLRNGDAAQRAENNLEAVEWFERVLEFDENDASVYYILAVNYISLGEWEKAIENANLALENNNGDLEDANVFYQLASAKQGQGNDSEACEYYEKVTSGPFRQRAEYEIEHVLDCD